MCGDCDKDFGKEMFLELAGLNFSDLQCDCIRCKERQKKKLAPKSSTDNDLNQPSAGSCIASPLTAPLV